MRYISIFSGIEAATVAWERLGWTPVAFAEIDAFPSAVLAARYPDVPNLGDVTKVDWSPYRGAVDLVVGGSPCQSFSVAGKREGLSGASGLMWEYIRCVQDVMPSWFIWENVPGAFNSERGWAFEQLLSSLDGCGFGMAWRVLDSQFSRIPVWDGDGGIAEWIGPVAQRRRRVFLVGHLGDMRACEVLFESESLRWDNPSSRETRKALARATGRGSTTGSLEVSGSDSDCLTPWDPQAKRIFTEDSCCPTLNSGADTNNTHIQPTVLQSIGGHADATTKVSEEVSQTLDTTGPPSCVYLAGFKWHQGAQARDIGYEDEQAPTLTTSWHQPAVLMRPMAFVENQQRQVRYFGGDGSLVGALSSQPGATQQTYVLASLQSNTEIEDDGMCPTITARSKKDPPVMVMEVDDGQEG